VARFDEPIEPMTLGNMRANGVRSLADAPSNALPGAISASRG
jgi:hypothetical protein